MKPAATPKPKPINSISVKFQTVERPMSAPSIPTIQYFIVLVLIVACVAEYTNGAELQEDTNGRVQYLRESIFRPSYMGFPRYYLEKIPIANIKRSMALGRSNFRPGKRSLSMELSPDLVDSFPEDASLGFYQDTGLVEQKRSAALGRSRFRPGKRSPRAEESDNLEGMAPYGSHGFSLLTEAQMGKRSAVLGRGGFRPAKRSMAVGRSRFRPGKRSIATGRAGFRPGKRSPSILTVEVPIADSEDEKWI